MQRQQGQTSSGTTTKANNQQPSPLSLLAATCSKIGSPTDENGSANNSSVAAGGGQGAVKVIGQSGHHIITQGDLTQFIPGQTVGVLNPDGTVTQLNPQVIASVSGSMGTNTPVKSITTSAIGNQLPQGAQILTQSPNAAGGISYSIIQPQQIQSIQVDGQEAIFIPASTFTGGQQAIQISGNQIISSPNQTVVRAQASAQNAQAPQTAYIQGIGNVSLAQLAGGQATTMPISVRQGNVLQTLQLPVSAVQQTIPVHVPISTANGQTVLQTIHLPVQAIQAVNAGQQVTAQVVPQMQQVTFNARLFDI